MQTPRITKLAYLNPSSRNAGYHEVDIREIPRATNLEFILPRVLWYMEALIEKLVYQKHTPLSYRDNAISALQNIKHRELYKGRLNGPKLRSFSIPDLGQLTLTF
ncbi:Hypothetical protein R9X50_00685100 [Acrodontium crateriforme]|uniref:Uncharacterized protein n=1 Tax=Acrodontium crateriforme TaxID=150365 RepID=A0AAQ3MBL8_9PEZI|nr:Hypothetical protein R9X50_00685100 [Acrodontium crateriforme]